MRLDLVKEKVVFWIVLGYPGCDGCVESSGCRLRCVGKVCDLRI